MTELIGGFESTYMPEHDVDVMELTGHATRWRRDFRLLSELGIRRLRYPIRWHRVEKKPRTYDWAATDAVLGHLRRQGFQPIVDLLHHTSYPRWLDGGFADPRFGQAYLRYVEAFCLRYPWVTEYTLFNEPFATLFLAGHEGVWPPHGRGMEDFVTLVRNVLPAVAEASRRVRKLLPEAAHVWVDTCEGHADAPGVSYGAYANDRRFLLLDLFTGAGVEGGRPFVEEFAAAGGGDLLSMAPGHVDVLGLDYYPHSEYLFTEEGPVTPSPQPVGLAVLAGQYWKRYRLPMLVTETNIRGFAPDRATWFKHVLEQCEQAVASGVPLGGLCWFPVIDSCDWDSLLCRADGRVDPVGVYWLDSSLRRHESTMSKSYARAAAGATSASLPAYRLQPPVSDRLRGFLRLMSHWQWQDPPAHEVVPPGEVKVHAVA